MFIMTFLSNITKCLISLLQKLGLRKRDSFVSTVQTTQEPVRPYGTTGRLDVPTLLFSDGPHLVLIVDYDFEDIPSWVEWDSRLKKLSVVQIGGAAAELPLGIPANVNAPIDETQRMMLVTGRYERRNAHFVNFIIRN